MDPLQPADPGRIGPYRLLARLGSGGMGTVYLGVSPGGRPVAVKVVLARFAADFEYRARFRREVAAARTVTGAFTAPVLDADPDATAPWLVTAYLRGLSLREAVRTFGGMTPTAVRGLAAGLAEALADIHRAGVVHRDLKPGNVMLTGDGPRVIDFGIARLEDATAITLAGTSIGTPGFMAPEQLAGERIGSATDIFALGAVLLYATTGRQPFGTGPPAIRLARAALGEADLTGITDQGWIALITACLGRRPEDRPTAGQLLDRLGGTALPPHGTGWLPPPVAEAIDRRAAVPIGYAPSGRPAAAGTDPAGPTVRVTQPPGSPEAVAPPPASAEATVPPSGLAEATVPPPASAEATVPPSGLAEATVEPRAAVPDGGHPTVGAETTAPAGSSVAGGVSRRTLLVAGAGGLVAVGGTVAWWRSGSPPPRNRSAAGPGTPSGPAVTTAPPRATARWTVKVGDYFPDLDFVGGLLVAHLEGRVRALDPATGRSRWTLAADYSAAAGGLVYLTDTPWRLSAVRASSGRVAWTYRGQFDQYPWLDLATAGPYAYFDGDRIRAVRTGSGASVWAADIGEHHGIGAGGGWLVAARPAELVGLDSSTGRRRWEYRMAQGVDPLIGEGLVFARDQHGLLHAVKLGGGLLWQTPIGNIAAGLRLADGVLYVSGRGGEVLAFRAGTGERLWSSRVGRGEGEPYSRTSALTVSGRLVYVSGTDRALHALDRADGRVRWTYPADLTLSSPVVAGNGLVYLGTRDGRVHAVVPPTEAPNEVGGSDAGS